MQVAQRRQDLEHVADRLGHLQPDAVGPGQPGGLLQRGAADVLHHDVADRVAVLVVVLDEVVDLDDPGVGHLGQELALGHRDRLGFGVAGVHQPLEHHRPVVDVLVERQVHPAQPAVGDAALDLVLVGDDVPDAQLRHEGVRAAAVRAPALGQGLAGRRGPAHRPSAVPAEPFRLGHHGVDHQRGLRIDRGNPRDLDQSAAEAPGRRQVAGQRRGVLLRLGVPGVHQQVVIVVVEVRPEHRLGGHRPHRGHRLHVHVVEAGRLGAGVHQVVGVVGGVDVVGVVGVVGVGHSSTYLARGGAGAGPSTVSHLRYSVFHVPSRRIRSSVPFT